MKNKTSAVALVILVGVIGVTRAADEAGGPTTDKPPAAAAGEAQQAAAGEGQKSVAAVIDKAVEALGGKDKVGAVKAATWSAKGTLTLGGADSPFTARLAYQGHDKRRVEFKTEIGGTPIDAVIVVDGEKGWRKFNGDVQELAGDDLVTERFGGYREWTPVAVLLLKSKEFKTEPAGDADVNGKPATGVKVTGPVGAPFTLYFDKATGLPAKLTGTVPAFGGGEAAEETVYAEYKDFGGVKKATVVESSHDGRRIIRSEITEFKVLDAAPAGTFDRPE